jgi:hypothetical protein
MAWTTSDLLTEVRRAGMLPSSSTSATADTDILAQADRAIQANLVPLLLSTQEEYLVRRVQMALSSGTAAYPVSRRAVGARVRNIALVSNGTRRQLVRVRPEEMDAWRLVTSGEPTGFYLDASDIVFLPTPTGGTVELAIYVRPGRLTASTNHRALTVVTANTDYSGAAAAGRTRLQWTTGLATSTLGTTADIVSAAPPFEHKGLDLTYNSAGGTVTSIDVTSASLLSTPQVGDVVSPVNESSMIQLPVECHPLLFQRTTQYLLEQLGYQAEAAMARDTADRMEADVRRVLTPRTDGNPQKLTGGMLEAIQRNGVGVWRY